MSDNKYNEGTKYNKTSKNKIILKNYDFLYLVQKTALGYVTPYVSCNHAYL
jgi:hypothetical protein